MYIYGLFVIVLYFDVLDLRPAQFARLADTSIGSVRECIELSEQETRFLLIAKLTSESPRSINGRHKDGSVNHGRFRNLRNSLDHGDPCLRDHIREGKMSRIARLQHIDDLWCRHLDIVKDSLVHTVFNCAACLAHDREWKRIYNEPI